jgi:putative tryptophan/tyrosine transport system substrate-binding protein
MISDFGMRISDWKNRSEARHRLRPNLVDGPKLVSKKPCEQFRSYFRRESVLRNLKSAILVGAMLFALSVSARAQQAQKIPRIGYLQVTASSAVAARTEAFRLGLRELGYVEGKNIVIDWRSADGKLERLPALATELVRFKVDAIVTSGATATRAVKEATKTIPIVMSNDPDPVGDGIIASLARPGENITGLSALAPELNGKRLEVLREVVTKLSRVAVLRVPTSLGGGQKKDLELAAKAFGVTLQYLDVLVSKNIETTFQAVSKGRADGVLVLASGIISAQRAQIADLAVKNRLPAIYHEPRYVEAGGLMSYGVSVLNLDRRAATYVDKILRGAKPADLPVEQPTKFEFIVNLKAAKQIGLTIPPNVLARADKVIK